MTDLDPVSRLLEDRHNTFLQWVEPWVACGPEGNALDAHVVLQATVHDCINLSRQAAWDTGRAFSKDDREHLLDFMAVHWARVVDKSHAK